MKLGLIPATIGPFVLQRIGAAQARRFFLTAEVFEAQKALEIGYGLLAEYPVICNMLYFELLNCEF